MPVSDAGLWCLEAGDQALVRPQVVTDARELRERSAAASIFYRRDDDAPLFGRANPVVFAMENEHRHADRAPEGGEVDAVELLKKGHVTTEHGVAPVLRRFETSKLGGARESFRGRETFSVDGVAERRPRAHLLVERVAVEPTESSLSSSRREDAVTPSEAAGPEGDDAGDSVVRPGKERSYHAAEAVAVEMDATWIDVRSCAKGSEGSSRLGNLGEEIERRRWRPFAVADAAPFVALDDEAAARELGREQARAMARVER